MTSKPILFSKAAHFLCSAAVLSLILTGNSFSETVSMHEHHHAGHDDMQMKEMQMKASEITVDIETVPAELKAGNNSKIIFTIKDGEGKPVQDLQVTHDRLLHVIIASADFTVFAHIHPDDSAPISDAMKKKAEYPVSFTFPKAGQYIVALDTAAGGNMISEHFTIDVGGEPKMGQLVKDFSREKKFGDLSVTLSTVPEKITAGEESTLKYVIKKDGKPVTDLEPFLSAPMHVAVISSDFDNFIHEHGVLPGSPKHGHTAHMMHMNVPKKFGPEIDVPVVFPTSGVYQIFSQVGYKGDVIVLSFMVEVN